MSHLQQEGHLAKIAPLLQIELPPVSGRVDKNVFFNNKKKTDFLI